MSHLLKLSKSEFESSWHGALKILGANTGGDITYIDLTSVYLRY